MVLYPGRLRQRIQDPLRTLVPDPLGVPRQKPNRSRGVIAPEGQASTQS